jgi:hypothetical protein
VAPLLSKDEHMERDLWRRFMGGGGVHAEDVARHDRGGRGLMHFVDRPGGVGGAWL